MENEIEHTKDKLLRYIAYLLNKRSFGSISSNLISEGLAKEPIVVSIEADFGFNIIFVCVKATENALNNVDHLTSAIFYQIKVLINEKK